MKKPPKTFWIIFNDKGEAVTDFRALKKEATSEFILNRCCVWGSDWIKRGYRCVKYTLAGEKK